MNSQIYETQRRISLLSQLSKDYNFEEFPAVLLTGSVAVGKNYSINPNSDIDINFIISREDLDLNKHKRLFQGRYVTSEGLKLFQDGKVDGIWSDEICEDILVNRGLISQEFFDKFCKGEVYYLNRYNLLRSSEKFQNYTKRGLKFYDLSMNLIENEETFLKLEGGHIESIDVFTNLILNEVIIDKINAREKLFGLARHSFQRFGEEFFEKISRGWLKANDLYKQRFLQELGK
jgi:hypothetical protein